MPMMQIRIVWVFVRHWRVVMSMRVGVPGRVAQFMRMLVMLVVPVPVFVHQLGMPVLVLMALGDVQVDAKRHQSTGADQRRRDRFAKHGHG